jgi:radical SAM-linked protein
MQRLRITFTKTAAMRFTGHLDLHKTWERTMRRARLPLAYSGGFHPQPRIQLAAALPLGFTSECEVVDVWMQLPQDIAFARDALLKAAPPGMLLRDVTEVAADAPALQTVMASADYRVTFWSPAGAVVVEQQVIRLLAAPEIRRTRRGKGYDLRPLVETLSYAGAAGDGHVLIMRLSARESATGRPEEVLDALEVQAADALFHRERLFLADGAVFGGEKAA